MEDVSTVEKLCMACNRWHSRNVMSCQCGHVLKDSVTRSSSSVKDISYRTRNSLACPGSLSSESTLTSSSPSPQNLRSFTYNENIKAPSPNRPQQRSTKRNPYKENNKKIKKNKFPRIIYRCKSYKKAKPCEVNFQFDFKMFDSNNPYYPSALSDINDRISRQNALSRFLNSYS